MAMSQSPPVSRTMKSVPKPRALLWPVFFPQLLQYIIFMAASPMMIPQGALEPLVYGQVLSNKDNTPKHFFAK